MKREKLWLSVIGLILLMLLMTSCNGNAQVMGVLVTDDGEPLQKVEVDMLCLEPTENDEFEGLANLEVAYEARTDDSGAFAFSDVKPGYYALSSWWVPGALPETGVLCITPHSEVPEFIGTDFSEDCLSWVLIEVEKGQEIDLGEIIFRY